MRARARAQAYAMRQGNREVASLMRQLASPLGQGAQDVLLNDLEQQLSRQSQYGHTHNGPRSKNASRNLKKASKVAAAPAPRAAPPPPSATPAAQSALAPAVGGVPPFMSALTPAATPFRPAAAPPGRFGGAQPAGGYGGGSCRYAMAAAAPAHLAAGQIAHLDQQGSLALYPGAPPPQAGAIGLRSYCAPTGVSHAQQHAQQHALSLPAGMHGMGMHMSPQSYGHGGGGSGAFGCHSAISSPTAHHHMPSHSQQWLPPQMMQSGMRPPPPQPLPHYCTQPSPGSGGSGGGFGRGSNGKAPEGPGLERDLA
jgi:hypothetical protein